MAKANEFRLIIASNASHTSEYPTYLSITDVEQRIIEQQKRLRVDTQLALVSGTHMGIEPQAALLADRLALPYYRFTQPGHTAHDCGRLCLQRAYGCIFPRDRSPVGWGRQLSETPDGSGPLPQTTDSEP